MMRIEEYFDIFSIAESTLGPPLVDGDRMRVPVDDLPALRASNSTRIS
jgi:hypothetical protein